MRRWIALAAAVGGIAGCGGSSVHHAVLTALDARTGTQRWSVDLPTASASTPVVTDGLVIVAGTNDCDTDALTVAALDALTGTLQWTRRVPTSGGSCLGAQVLGSGTSVVVTSSGNVLACPQGQSCPPPSVPIGAVLDARSGNPMWKLPVTAQAVLAATASAMVAVDQSGALLGLDPATGAQRWRTAGASGSYAGASSGTGCFVLGRSSDGEVLRAVNTTSGRTDWTAHVLVAGGGYAPVAGTAVVVTVVQVHTVYPSVLPGASKSEPPPPTATQVMTAYDPQTGRVLWRTTSSGDVSSTAESAGLVVISTGSSGGSKLDGYDPVSGVRRWQVGREGLVAMVAADSVSVVGTGGGLHGAFTFGLDASTGRETWRTSIIGSTLVVDSGTAYVGTVGRPSHLSDE